MSSYLVTGGAGFIGSRLIEKLKDDGSKVTTIDNLSTGYKKNIPKGVRFIKGDCANKNIYNKLRNKKFDAIFHIAGQSSGEISFDNPIYDINSNTCSTILLLKYALKTGCRRLIYASTMSVYGSKPNRPIKESDETSPESFYGVSKLASENYLKIFSKYGIKYTALRLFNVYGPGQNLENLKQGMISIYMAQMIKNNSVIVKGSASRYRDFIYIDDVINFFVQSIKNKKSYNKIINVGTGKKVFVYQILEKMKLLKKNKFKVKYGSNTPGDVNGIYANIVLLNRVFGKKKFTTINQGLLKMYSSIIKD